VTSHRHNVLTEASSHWPYRHSPVPASHPKKYEKRVIFVVFAVIAVVLIVVAFASVW
jgi:lipopolysaccharide/colanic/teichoic acid biosynthesis glycosyltransferase